MLIMVIIRHSGADEHVRRCRPVIAERLEPNKTTAKKRRASTYISSKIRARICKSLRSPGGALESVP